MADIILLRIIKETLQKNLDMCKYSVLASEIEEKVRLYYELDRTTITDIELVKEVKRRCIKIEIPGNDNKSDFCSSERPHCYACDTICTPVTKIKIGEIIFDIKEDDQR